MPVATTGIASSEPNPGNNRGTRPATPASPDYLANTIEDRADRQHFFAGRRFGAAVLNEVLRRVTASPEPEVVEGDAEEIEIETVFRRKLAGLRQLPKRERSTARKAARDWRTQALKALREKRANSRCADRLRRMRERQRNEIPRL